MAATFKKTKVEIATFRDFRHSRACWTSDAGVDPYTIMEIGSWADMKTLLRYLHRTRANRQNAVEKISGALGSHPYATWEKIHKMPRVRIPSPA